MNTINDWRLVKRAVYLIHLQNIGYILPALVLFYNIHDHITHLTVSKMSFGKYLSQS